MKKTPLYDDHAKLGGKLIDFGGWALPVEYQGIIEEHLAVRSTAGLFDVSHMGEIRVEGADAETFLQKMLTNDISAMKEQQVYYTLMCYPDGGIVDDLIVYKYHRQLYLLVVNASTTEKDYAWLQENLTGEVTIHNVSSQYAQLSLQGPKAQEILQNLTQTNLDSLPFFHFLPEVKIDGISTMVSRTGYTGEDGFEIYVDPASSSVIWQILLMKGKPYGLVPVGLGARDTLRFEAALPLYGQEISKDISPLEADLGFFVKLNKQDFIGKQALMKQKQDGIPRKLVGFEMMDRGIPRTHYAVSLNDQNIGYVTTGGFSPSLKKNIGLALIDSRYAQVGEIIEIAVRNKKLNAKIIPKPFHKKKYRK